VAVLLVLGRPVDRHQVPRHLCLLWFSRAGSARLSPLLRTPPSRSDTPADFSSREFAGRGDPHAARITGRVSAGPPCRENAGDRVQAGSTRQPAGTARPGSTSRSFAAGWTHAWTRSSRSAPA